MNDQTSSLKFQYRTIYLPILTFAIMTGTMPIMGRIVFWVSIGLVFCCLVYSLYKIRTINKAYLIWVLAFCTFFLFSRFWALDQKLVDFVLIVRILPILIVTFSVSMYIKTLEDIYDILRVFYFVAILVLVYLLLFVDITSIEDRMSYDQLGDNWNTNTVGIQFVFAIFSGFILFWRKNILIKSTYIFISVLMIFVTLVTGSRKAIIMFFIPIVYLLIFNKKIKPGVKFISLLFGSIFVFVLFSIPFFYDIAGARIMDMINMLKGNPTGEEDSSRLFLILYGWLWFKENIWIGYGINNYRVLSNTTDMFAGKDFYAHCNYIELLVGVGIIGTLIYYSGFFYILRKAYKQNSTVSKWIIALVLVLLFIDIAQVTYYGLIYMLFICIGFSVASLNHYNN